MTLAKIYTNKEHVLIDLEKIYAIRTYCIGDSEGFIKTVEVSIDNSYTVFRVDIDSHKYCLPVKKYLGRLRKFINDELFDCLTKKQTDINIYDIVMPAIYKLREIDDIS